MDESNISEQEKGFLTKLLAKLAKPEGGHAKLTGLFCDRCRREMKEGDKYFVRENSFAHIEFKGDEMSEVKERAWQTEMLCMRCHERQFEPCSGSSDCMVEDYQRETE